MKPGIHPQYRQVVFHDTSVDKYFLIGSTLQTDRTIEWEDGQTYPYFTIEVSSESHRFTPANSVWCKKRVEWRISTAVLANLTKKRSSNMKVLSSLKSAKSRHPDCQIVKRRGRLYVICKSNPRFKAVQK